MPALMNIGVNLALGAAMALAVRRSPALHRSPVSWSLLLLLAFQALVFTPAATFVFRFYPQWSMLYWFDPQVFPRLSGWTGTLSFVVVILNFMAAITGYMIARLGIIIDKKWMWILPLCTAAGIIAYVAIGFGERVVFVGDYDAFWAGEAEMLLVCLPGWLGLVVYLTGGLLVRWVHQRFGERDPSFL